MTKSLEFLQKRYDDIHIGMISSLPPYTKQILISEGISKIKDLCNIDPFEFSSEYGLDIQTTMLAFREASILMSRRIPTLAPFPKSPILLNISYLPVSDNKIWFAGITTGVSILHWLSFSYKVEEEIILNKLEFHLLPLVKHRSVICISQFPNALEITKEKVHDYGLKHLSSVLETKTMSFSNYLSENLLWYDENRFESILKWLDFSDNPKIGKDIQISEEVAKDLHFYGNLRKKTALEAVQHSVDLFEAVQFFKDHLAVV